MRRLNEKGYSLMESVIHLLIFSIVIQLSVLFFYWQAPITQVYQEDLLGEWELFSLELQDLLKEVDSIDELNSTGLTFSTARGKITIHQYQKMLRKLVNGAGHVPLLMNVKTCKFTVYDNQLQVAVEMTDGTRKERMFAVGLHPK